MITHRFDMEEINETFDTTRVKDETRAMFAAVKIS